MTKLNCIIFLGVVVAAIDLTSAITEDEKKAIHDIIVPILDECGKQFHISKEDVIAAKMSHNYDAIDPCVYACFFKKVGIMNDKGVYDPASAKADQRKYIHGQDDLNKLDATAEKCSSVNDEDVGDDPEGCQRAKLLVRCFDENKSQINPLSE